MSRNRFRIGSIAVLFAVVVLCVAIFGVLTAVSYTHLDVYKRQALNHDASISSLLDPHAKIDALLQKRALEKAKIIDEQL